MLQLNNTLNEANNIERMIYEFLKIDTKFSILFRFMLKYTFEC